MTADLVSVVMARVREREAAPLSRTVRATTLRCWICRQFKDDEQFAKHRGLTRRRGRRDSCRSCARIDRERLQATRPEVLRAWWLDRFTLAEIREMAAGLEFLSTALQQRPAARSRQEALRDGHQPKGNA